MKANDLLDMIGNVDDSIIEEAKQKKKALPKWTKWLAAAACLCLVLGGIAAGTFNTLYRLGYFRVGCGSLPGTIIDGDYYYHVHHSGLWRYSNGKSEKLIGDYWMDGYVLNESGLYYDDYSDNLYRIDLQTLKKKKIYSAPFAKHIDFSVEDDGKVIVTVYKSKKKYYYSSKTIYCYKVLIDGETGEVLERLTDKVSYDAPDEPDTNESTAKLHYTIGEREIVLVPIGRADDRMYMPTENGKALLPDGRWVHDGIYTFCDEVKSFGVYNVSDESEESEILIIFADGKTHLKPKEEEPFYQGTIGHILLYTAYDDTEKNENNITGIWCYDIESEEKWRLKTDTEHSFYNFTNDEEMLYSCEPWKHDHAAWKIIYEGNRPVALHLIDDKITD